MKSLRWSSPFQSTVSGRTTATRAPREKTYDESGWRQTAVTMHQVTQTNRSIRVARLNRPRRTRPRSRRRRTRTGSPIS